MEYLSSQGLTPNPWEHQVLYEVLEPHGREYSPTHSAKQKQEYFDRLARRIFDRLGVQSAHASHANAIWELIGPSSLQLYQDVVSALRTLQSAGYRLIIISNWQCGLEHYCTELGIAKFFEHICASAEVGHEKPDPQIFAEAARRLSLPHSRILHIGDSRHDDLEGARTAGMHAALIDRRPESARSTDVIRTLTDVVGLLSLPLTPT